MSDVKHLKCRAKAWLGFTGELGGYQFEDGVSVDALPRPIRDRLAAAFEFDEIDVFGKESPAGVAHRLVTTAADRQPVIEPSVRQTDAEKLEEDARAAKDSKAPDVEIYTREQLEEIAGKGGIKAVREIAEPWQVKHRNIIELINLILARQTHFVEARQKRLEDSAEQERANAAAAAPPVVTTVA